MSEPVLADVMAYLASRMNACGAQARKAADQTETMQVMMRQLGVIMDDLRAGMHVGMAADAERNGA